MKQQAQFIAQNTKESYPIDEVIWKGKNGDLLNIDFQPELDWEKFKNRPANLWRYQETFPLANFEDIVSFGEGFTPLLDIELNQKKVKFKLDYLFPSGSYKDRGASILISQAKALGVKKVVQDSSGNAGSAIAAYCALAGIDCEIFVPANTSTNKLTQIQAYGAKLTKVDGTREDTANAALEAAQHHFYASHVWNPFFHQGTKTFLYEVWEQLNYHLPDVIVLPAGNGTLLLGVFIALQELKSAGLIQDFPKLIGIQAKNCAPLYQVFENAQKDFTGIKTNQTLAEGIAIAQPRRGKQMLEQVQATNGRFLAVSEEEIKKAWQEMAKKGFYIEPTSAAVVAGVKQYLQNFSQKDEKIVSVLTGNGLKSGDKFKI